MRTAKFFGSEIYRGSSLGERHPLSIPRISTVIDLCRSLDWFGSGQYRRSPRARPAALRMFHTEPYLNALQRAEETGFVDAETRQRHKLGTISNPVYPEMFRRPATSAGGSMQAAELLREGGAAFNPGGGTHHGMPNYASGFCYLNDPVLAIRVFQSFGLARIVYIDIDAHHCDGVEAALAGDTRVLMISTHEARRWPFTGALTDDAGGNAVNLPLPSGSNDEDFTLAREELILPLTQAFKPEAIILQCGADAVREDPLSRLDLTNNAHWDLVTALRPLAPRFLVLGGGGYNPWSVARLWTGVWAKLNGLDVPDRLPSEAQAMLNALHWNRRGGARPDPYLTTTLQDTKRDGPLDATVKERVRFLRQRQKNWF